MRGRARVTTLGVMECDRRFLGWDEGVPSRLADAILSGAPRSEVGIDLSGVLVVTPGRRAGRVVLGALVEQARGSALVPPVLITPGELASALTDRSGDPVSGLAKRVLWMTALRGADPGAIRGLIPIPPRDDDHGAWARLAAWCERVCDDLSAEGMRAKDAMERGGRLLGAEELARWRVLADLQARYERILQEHGRVDDRLGALDAIRGGSWSRNGFDRLVLAGVVELPGSAREALGMHGALRAVSLVCAPESCAPGFDAMGLVRGAGAHEFWRSRRGAIPDERILFADDPDALAHDALAQLALRQDPVDPGACSIGLVDPSMLVGLKLAALHGSDARIRSGSGETLASTAPGRLVALVGALTAEETVDGLIDLAQHPDAERVVRGRLREQGFGYEDSISSLMTLRREHMVVRGTEAPESVHDRVRSGVKTLRAEIRKICGEALLDPSPKPISVWASAVRGVLGRVYGARVFERADPDGGATRDALERLGDLLWDLEREEILGAADVDAAEAMALLTGRLSEIIVSEPQRGDELECLGWLELLHDPAPMCVIVGMDDASVPGSNEQDPLLTRSVRELIGMATDESRLSRDLYLSEAINASRDAVFMCSRIGSGGEPTLLSRVLMNETGSVLAHRVRRFSGADGADEQPTIDRRLGAGTVDGFRVGLVVQDDYTAPESMSVTDFDAYLRSQAQWYLERVLKLRDEDPSPWELDARRVGHVVHTVLQRFGEDPSLKDSSDAARIGGALVDLLGEEARREFGARAPGAVRVQLMMLEHRLGLFAAHQARWRGEGWRIRKAEWKPGEDDDTSIDVDGVPMRLRAKIDRIDVNEHTNEWAVIDYKTGSAKDAIAEHYSKVSGVKRLQLPLYRHVVRSLSDSIGLEGEPMLGYGVIPGSAQDRVWSVQRWDPGVLHACDERAWEIVREIRALTPGATLRVEHSSPEHGMMGFISGLRFDSGGREGAGDADDDESGDAA